MKILEPDTILDSKYKVVRRLGRGCLGETYLCHSISKGKKVAVKFLEFQEGAVGGSPLLFNYMSTVMKAGSSGLLPVLDFGKTADYPYCVTEYSEGGTFRKWLKETMDFPTRMSQGFAYLERLASIANALHEMGMFAYVKPENIFIDGEGLRLSDWWVPPLLQPQDYRTRAPATLYLAYLPPEAKVQWSAMTPAGDSYGIGALFYEILLGKPPMGTLGVPSQASKFYSQETDTLLERVLNANPDHRLSLAGEWATELQLCLERVSRFFDPASRREPPIKAEEYSPIEPTITGKWKSIQEKNRLAQDEGGGETAAIRIVSPHRQEQKLVERQSLKRIAVAEPEDEERPLTIERKFSQDIEEKKAKITGRIAMMKKATLESEVVKPKSPRIPSARKKGKMPLWLRVILWTVGIGFLAGSVVLGLMAGMIWK